MTVPAAFDPLVAAFADSPEYNRRELVELLGSRLDPADRQRLADAGPAELSELAASAGATPAAVVAILAAEKVDAHEVAALLPTVGVPMPDAIRVLDERWDVPRTEAATLLDATGPEMREAGCSAAEILSVRPRDVLRSLPDDPRLWELAAGTMAAAGHSPSVVVNHLVAHAPTPDAFAAGLTSGVDDPTDGVTLAVRAGAHPDQLAALTERYGLSPRDVALTFADLRPPAPVVLDTLLVRCEGDVDAAVELAATTAGVRAADLATWRDPPTPATVPISRWGGLDLGSADELLADLPPATSSRQREPLTLELEAPRT